MNAKQTETRDQMSSERRNLIKCHRENVRLSDIGKESRNPFYLGRNKIPSGRLSYKYLTGKFRVVEISWHCIKY